MTTFAQSPFSLSLSLPVKKVSSFEEVFFCARENRHAGRVCYTFFTWAKQSGPRTVRVGMGRTRLGPNSKKNVKSGRKRLGIGFQISM